MKKLFATFLALVMMMSLMSVTAFAAPERKAADLDGHTYEAYQIFKGTQAEGKAELADIDWGTGVDRTALLNALKADATFVKEGTNLFADCSSAADVAKVISDAKWIDDSPEARAFAKDAYNSKSDTGIECEAGITSLEAGYYLVVDVTEADEEDEDFVTNLALLQLTQKDTFDIKNKVDVPEVEKKIIENNVPVDENDVSVGQTVNYQVTGTLPTDIADYNTYKYVFHDTMSKGLTYNDDMKVYVKNGDNKVEVTDFFSITASTYNATNGTTIEVTIADLMPLITDENSEIVLEYSGELNENAVIGAEGNPNDVYLEYSNNPNESGEPGQPDEDAPTGKTPKDTVKTYTTELTILKTDETGAALTGAAFKLEGTNVVETKVTGTKYEPSDYTVEDGEAILDGTYYLLKDGTYTTTAPKTGDDADNSKYADIENTYVCVSMNKWVEKTEDVSVEAYVDAEGKLVFTGLGAGTYTLTETKTPAGYNSIDPITVTVVRADDNSFYIDELADDTHTMSYTVVNQSGSTLPETGGIGTTIFYAVGGLLVVGAAVMLVAKKRMDGEI